MANADGTPMAPDASAGVEGSQDAALLAALDAKTPDTSNSDAELFKRLESLDPQSLPESVRRKFEAPFQADYTRKTQEISREREQLLNLVTARLAQQGITPTEDQLGKLREEVKSGNFDVIDQFVNRSIEERVGPFVQQYTLNQAIEQANKMNPLVKEREAEVSEVLRSNPALVQMATANNHQFAPMVLAGIASHIEARELRAKLAEAGASSENAKKQAVAEYQAKLRGLPAESSRAGSTPRTAPSSAGLSDWDIMKKAWVDAGGTLEPGL